MGRWTRHCTRRVAAVGGLLVLGLIAGAAPAVAAPGAAPGCAGEVGQRARGAVGGLLAALGVAVHVPPVDVPAVDVPAADGAAVPLPAVDLRVPGRPVAVPCPVPPRVSTGHATSAAALHGWGEPTRVDEFDGTGSGDAALGEEWNIYDSPGHGGNGRRTPDAVSVRDGIMTISGDPEGNTAGMEWGGGQRYGRWEGRVKAPASDPSYNALLLLWPDAEDFPVGGEIDFMEMMDHTRQKTHVFLHYGEDNRTISGSVVADGTQWHNWAVEWTPTHIATYLDGEEWWRTERTEIFPPGPMHLCIQLDWFPKEAEGPVQTSTMEVDWVKQYALSPEELGTSVARNR